MSDIRSHTGSYLSDQAMNKRLRGLFIVWFGVNALMLLMGFAAAKNSPYWLLASAATMLLCYWPIRKHFELQIRLSQNYVDGLRGEHKLLPFLASLPDTFVVFSDVTFPGSFGNIDHLVIGPTGFFALDVKNWSGVVASNGNGELLWNDHETEKPEIKMFTGRATELNHRLVAFASFCPFIQCLFVFPQTRVDAKWGSTGKVHCIRASRVEDYILNYKSPTKLTLEQIRTLSDAVSTRFTSKV